MLYSYGDETFLLYYLFKQLKTRVIAFVILALIFNSSLQVLASSYALDHAQQYANEDSMMICTGSSFKWISTSAYFDLGKIVYIDPPKNNSEKITEIDCSLLHLSDPQSLTPSISSLLDDFVAYKATAISLAKRPYTSYPYKTSQSRAPPHS